MAKRVYIATSGCQMNVVPAGGVAVRRAAASASAVVMPPLVLVFPIAPSTEEIGDDGGSSTGSGVSGRAAPNAVGESGFTPPVPARGIGCCGAAVLEPAAGVGGGLAVVGRCTVGASSPAGRNGVGLHNTRVRLEKLYGERHRFELERASPRGLSVVLTLPFRVTPQGALAAPGTRGAA
jgi:hypothetical protein